MPQDNAQRSDEGDDQPRPGRRPVETAKHGNVEIAIWKNEGSGGDFYTASKPTIRYKDRATGEFKDGNSFDRHDLLDMAEAAREAATKIRDLSRGRGQGK
jgi:hypothetical protein